MLDDLRDGRLRQHRPDYEGPQRVWPAKYTGDPWIKRKLSDDVILGLRQGLTEREIATSMAVPLEEVAKIHARATKFGFLDDEFRARPCQD